VRALAHSAAAHIPTSARRRIAEWFPRLGRKQDPLPAGGIFDGPFFDRWYAASEVDPWRIDDIPHEPIKFARILELCGNGPFRRALEIGCAAGTFTRRLAPRCEQLVAVDISSVAVERALRRLDDMPHVQLETMAVPRQLPSGTFDLIVASDVLYYWQPSDLHAEASKLTRLLDSGGRFVAVHYTGPAVAASSGSAVHRILREELALRHVVHEEREFAAKPYVLDVFER
jgi:predicted TPR repeat methyltransferase